MSLRYDIRLLAAMMAAAFLAVSCMDVEDAPLSPREIAVKAASGAAVKAPVEGTAFPADRPFDLTAYHTPQEGAVETYFTDVPFAKDGDVWRASSPKYWPAGGTLSFVAHTAFPPQATRTESHVGINEWQMYMGDNSATQHDVMVAFGAPASASPAPLVFRHALAQLCFTAAGDAYDAVSNTGVTVTGVEVLSLAAGGDCRAARSGADGATFTWSSLVLSADRMAVTCSVNTTSAQQTLGAGYLVPGQPARNLRVHYVMHNGYQADGTTPQDNTCVYDWSQPSGAAAWAAGMKYTYAFTFDAAGITCTATAVPWTDVATVTVEVQGTPDETLDYLRFDVHDGGRITWTCTDDDWSRTIEYSVNGAAWTQLRSTTSGASFPVVAGDIVKIRGNNAAYGAAYSAGEHWNSFGCDGGAVFAASGNVMSLIDPQTFETKTSITTAGALRRVFNGCSGLTAAPELPATTLAQTCYEGMFAGCSLLSDAPLLPATRMQAYAYMSMFEGCSSLRTPPALPATTLAQACYQKMFSGCIALETAPALNVMSLAIYCYSRMFEGCISLEVPPALPATTLANYCYEYMFSGCTSLRTVPALNATTGKEYCYRFMFQDCASLTAAPVLPMTTLGYGCYMGMFQNCTDLTSAPVLPAVKMTTSCYRQMFQGCVALVTPPALPAETLAQYCYYQMFEGCTSLTTAPTLPAMNIPNYGYARMFYNCTSLLAAPELPATTVTTRSYSEMFYNCRSMTTGPSVLPALTVGNYTYVNMFSYCASLTTAPAIEATTMSSTSCFQSMFLSCTSLVTPPPAIKPDLITSGSCYQMFYNCQSLASAPEIWATRVSGSYNFYYMFYNCRALQESPVMHVQNLSTRGCCCYMYYNCIQLRKITCLATSVEGYQAINGWVYQVPTTKYNGENRVFVKDPSATWPETTARGAHGVPANWTIVDYSE